MNIHPTAIIDSETQIGSGVTIGPYSVIGKEVVIGDDCRIGANVIIEDGTQLGSRCRVSPGVVLGGLAQDIKYEGRESFVKIGADNLIREFVTVHRSNQEGGATVIGDNNFLMAYSHVGHDCVIGNHTVITNYTGLSGHVTVDDYAVLSGHVGIHQFVSIGAMAMVGGASRVVKDVPPYVIVQGNPLRVRGINSVGLQRNGVSSQTREKLKKAYKLIFRSGLNTTQALEEVEKTLEPEAELEHMVSFIRRSSRGISK